MEEKIYDIKLVARYIALSLLTKQMTVSPLKLQKLLYYAQAWSMVFFGRQRHLFADVPQAWVNGPVYPVIYNIWKDKNMCDHLLPEDFETTKETMDDALCSVTTQLNLSDDEILTEELIGMKAYNDNALVGNITEYREDNGNKNVRVDDKLVPYNKDFISKIDKQNREIHFHDIGVFL